MCLSRIGNILTTYVINNKKQGIILATLRPLHSMRCILADYNPISIKFRMLYKKITYVWFIRVRNKFCKENRTLKLFIICQICVCLRVCMCARVRETGGQDERVRDPYLFYDFILYVILFYIFEHNSYSIIHLYRKNLIIIDRNHDSYIKCLFYFNIFCIEYSFFLLRQIL